MKTSGVCVLVSGAMLIAASFGGTNQAELFGLAIPFALAGYGAFVWELTRAQ